MPHFLSSSSIASQIDEEKNTCCSVWFERSGEIDDYTAICDISSKKFIMTLKIIFYTKPLYINIYKQFNLIGYEDDVEPRNWCRARSTKVKTGSTD